MPEIVEVCLTAELLNKNIKNKTIVKINILDGRYSRKEPEGFKSHVNKLPLQILKVSSHGKFMWIKTYNPNKNKKTYIFNTFGLSGNWSFYKTKYSKLEFILNDTEKNKIKLYYNDKLGFGTFNFDKTKDELHKKINTLGNDYLKYEYTLLNFKNKIYKLKSGKLQTKNMVEILMDQKKLGAGIGNYLCSEILYRAKISPHTQIKDLTDKKIEKLYNSILYTIKLSYISATKNNYYLENLSKCISNFNKKNHLPHIKLKDGDCFEFQVYMKKKDPYGNTVKKEVIMSKPQKRSTFWVDKIQK